MESDPQYTQLSNKELQDMLLYPEQYDPAVIDLVQKTLQERRVAIVAPEPEVVYAASGQKEAIHTGTPFDKISWDFAPSETEAGDPLEDIKAEKWQKLIFVTMIIVAAYFIYASANGGVGLLYGLCIYGMHKRKRYGWRLLQYIGISGLVALLLELYQVIAYEDWEYFQTNTGLLRIVTTIYFAGVLVLIHKDNMMALYSISPQQRRKSLIYTICIILLIRSLVYFR